ncbi:MAG: ribbon-helix-helix domain-containing protein [Phycisphaerales bacterium]
MSRKPISITLEESMIARIDKFAEDIGVTRTAIIEQAIKNDLPEQEAFHKCLENPVIRGIHKTLSSPAVLEFLKDLSRGEISDQEISNIMEKGPRQREAARARAAAKKPLKRKPGQEGAS